MYFYLPIAGISTDVLSLIGLGFIAGLLAGICGLGGGLITTPILIMIGVQHKVAVPVAAMQILASSFTSVLVQAKNNLIAYKLGFFLLIGGFLGGILGVKLFNYLSKTNSLEISIHLSYLFFLTYVGVTILIDLYNNKMGNPNKTNFLGRYAKKVINKLPFKVYFPLIESKISIIFVLLLGIIGGMLVSFMGIGGGLVLVPLMIYMLKINPRIAVATSLFQILFTSSLSCYLHSTKSQSIDLVLAIFIILGASIGSQIGSRLVKNLSPNTIKIILGITVLTLALKLVFDLTIPPFEIYEVKWNI